MEHTLSPDASPADGDRRATMKRQKTAEPPPEELYKDIYTDQSADFFIRGSDFTASVGSYGERSSRIATAWSRSGAARRTRRAKTCERRPRQWPSSLAIAAAFDARCAHVHPCSRSRHSSSRSL